MFKPEGLLVAISEVNKLPQVPKLYQTCTVHNASESIREFGIHSPGAFGFVGFSGVPEARWRADVKNLFTEAETGLAINYDPALRKAFRAAGPEIAPLWPLFDALAGLPLALIHGAGSDILSQATAGEMRARRPDMRYVRLEGRGHVPWLDEPEALAVIRAWLGDMR